MSDDCGTIQRALKDKTRSDRKIKLVCKPKNVHMQKTLWGIGLNETQWRGVGT